MDLSSVQNIIYNGNTVAAVICNGVTAWPSVPRAIFDFKPLGGAEEVKISVYSGGTYISSTSVSQRTALSIPIGYTVSVNNYGTLGVLAQSSLDSFSALSSTGSAASATVSGFVKKYYSASGILTGNALINWSANYSGAPFTSEYSANASPYDGKTGSASLVLTAVNYDLFGVNNSAVIVVNSGSDKDRNINSNLVAAGYDRFSGTFVQSGDPAWWDGIHLSAGDRISGLVQQSGSFGTVSASASASASATYTLPKVGSAKFTKIISQSNPHPSTMKLQSVKMQVGYIGAPDISDISLHKSFYTVTASGYL